MTPRPDPWWCRRRAAIWIAITLAVVVAALLATLAIPIRSWRTGRMPVPPLGVTESAPPAAMSRRIWIDTDAACGVGKSTDPDDCFAIALLARAEHVRIEGISTVFGNATLSETDSITRTLIDAIRDAHGSGIIVHTGSAGPEAPAAAHAALRQALAEGPLTIVALGPLTNIAAALDGRADLQRNVSRIVAVMGRRQGHIFHPAEGSRAHSLLGHGPVFRDLNAIKDIDAASEILAMKLPLTLIPYDVARHVSLTGEDLDRMAAAGPDLIWIAERSRTWLRFWQNEIGQLGFYPFDLLAAVYVLRPTFFDCARARVWIGRDPSLFHAWLFSPRALLVGAREPDAAEPDDAEAIYCTKPSPQLHEWVLRKLTG